MAPVLTRKRSPILHTVTPAMILGPADLDPPTKVDGERTRQINRINNNVNGSITRAPKITGGNWEISAADMRIMDPVIWDAIACGLL